MQYYNEHAYEYSEKTLPISMAEMYEEFLQHIPKNGFILDAGCGSGRDSLHFLKLGYKVEAFDGSEEMAKLAGLLTGLPVKSLQFQDMIPCSIFDGVWANASLLHVPQGELQDVLQTIRSMLKPGGTLYCSFKYGERDSVDELGRSFTNKTCKTLDNELEAAGFTARRKIFVKTSTLPEGGTQDWVIALATAPE